MEIIKRSIEKETKDFKISVVQFKDNTYEIAILAWNWYSRTWEIDYSVFNDVLKADTSMEVYGTIQYIIAPAYFDKYEVDLTI